MFEGRRLVLLSLVMLGLSMYHCASFSVVGTIKSKTRRTDYLASSKNPDDDPEKKEASSSEEKKVAYLYPETYASPRVSRLLRKSGYRVKGSFEALQDDFASHNPLASHNRFGLVAIGNDASWTKLWNDALMVAHPKMTAPKKEQPHVLVIYLAEDIKDVSEGGAAIGAITKKRNEATTIFTTLPPENVIGIGMALQDPLPRTVVEDLPVTPEAAENVAEHLKLRDLDEADPYDIKFFQLLGYAPVQSFQPVPAADRPPSAAPAGLFCFGETDDFRKLQEYAPGIVKNGPPDDGKSHGIVVASAEIKLDFLYSAT